tara:strand:- start:689 stop:1822 length:1134 start_codon:yes stop_codon:yes gene_type:complete
MKFIIQLKIIFLKIISLNISFLKREISGYPEIVKNFEKSFSIFIGKKYGITFCNGTSSIEAAIYALNFFPNDEILVPASTFHASIGPINNLDCKPVFVDVDKDSLTISCEDLKKKINNKSKAILIVHPWGYPCNMDEVVKIARENNLKLIEDCSHAHGALFNNKKIGSFGDISCFSLQGAKSIAAGEGGISLTDNHEYFLRMSIYGHFNRHQESLKNIDEFKKFSKTGISKKLRAHPLGISLATIDFNNLKILNNYKEEIYKKIDKIILDYKTLKTMTVNHKAERGGYFGGYPIIFNDIEKISLIKERFKKFKINLIENPWPLNHKLEIYRESNSYLPVTEQISNLFFLIKIPYFLNFDFKKLKECLKECKRDNLIN